MLTGLIRYRKVEEVTTSKDEPTPIYLLGELVKASQTSPEDAQHIVEHLMKKLDSKNPVVKAKALRACKYLVQNGAFDVQRILQRTPAPIRHLQTFKGPPDVLKGDALNERVRVSAREAIEAIFSNGTAPQGPAKTNSISSRYQGFGSQRSSGMISISHDQYRPTAATPQQQTTFLNDTPRVETEVVPPRRQEAVKVSTVLGDEEEIVDNICQPGGVRLAPNKDDLRRFIDTVGTLNGTKIALHLQKKLEETSWQECYRALCVIEAVILQGSSVSCGEIGVHFQGDLGMIRNCASSVQSSVRDRANRILSIFTEVGEEPQTELQETPSLLPDPNKTVAPMMDLLGDIQPEQEEKSDIVSSLESLDVSDPNPVTDMFSGMSLVQAQAPGKESNEHLAALLAPSPPSDPFPEASVPIQPQSIPTQPSISTPAPPQMQPAVFQMPGGYPPHPMQAQMSYFMQPTPQQGVMYPQGPPRMDSRGEVPLAAFYGPAHTQKRNSAGKNAPTFDFIGDHMTELRGKK